MGIRERPPDRAGITFAVGASLVLEIGLEGRILELEKDCDIFHFNHILLGNSLHAVTLG